MPSERQLEEALRERSFREVFPWRNVTKALFLIVAIAGVVVMKRQIDPLLKTMGSALSMPAPPAKSPPTVPSSR